MSPDSKTSISLVVSILSLGVAVLSLCVTTLFNFAEYSAGREILELDISDFQAMKAIQHEVPIILSVTLSNRSARTISIVKAECFTASDSKEIYEREPCEISARNQLPIQLDGGAAQSFLIKTLMRPPKNIMQLQDDFEQTYPDKDFDTFLAYLFENFGLDYFGNELFKISETQNRGGKELKVPSVFSVGSSLHLGGKVDVVGTKSSKGQAIRILLQSSNGSLVSEVIVPSLRGGGFLF